MVHRKIQRDFDVIIDWTFCNNLRLNHDKAKAMIFSTRNRISNLDHLVPFILKGHSIKYEQSHAYLGITLDSMMTIYPLVKSVNKCVTNKIVMLRKIRKLGEVLIYKQTILPLIDYAGFILISCNVDHKDYLQKLQNDVLRICCNYRLSDMISIECLHKECKIISIE